MPLFLAIDAGGTRTQYLLADEERELARTESGSIKRLRVSAEQASLHLATALAALEAGSGVRMQQVDLTCVGASGSSIALVADWLRSELPKSIGGELLLLNDVEIALDAAFQDRPGVLALAGTGSNVVGRSIDGALTGAGGWGPVLGDQASGHRIGTEALRALFLAIDEGEPTQLMDMFLEHWGLSTRPQLVQHANSCGHSEFSRLSHPVGLAAAAGDAVAQRVLRSEGRQLGHLVCLVLKRMQAAAATEALPDVAFSGGVMQHLPMVREALLQHVREQFPSIHDVPGVSHGVDGALWRARRTWRGP